MFLHTYCRCPHDLSAQGQLLKFGPVWTQPASNSPRSITIH